MAGERDDVGLLMVESLDIVGLMHPFDNVSAVCSLLRNFLNTGGLSSSSVSVIVASQMPLFRRRR